jgi:hypothetical protein
MLRGTGRYLVRRVLGALAVVATFALLAALGVNF